MLQFLLFHFEDLGGKGVPAIEADAIEGTAEHVTSRLARLSEMQHWCNNETKLSLYIGELESPLNRGNTRAANDAYMPMRMEAGGRTRRRVVVKRENGKVAPAAENVMDLRGMSLVTLPNPVVISLASITKLDLSNNNLEIIPESLTARMVNVVILDVHSNELKALPNSIGCLSHLNILDVSSNLLESLPDTIENCRALEDLILNFNKLTTLPATIGFELINLRVLSVNTNKLRFLPPSTSHMTSLRILDAHLNCLHSLPDGLENLTLLEHLDLSKNFQYLRSLPYSLGLLYSLHHLDVSYNALSSLPDSFGCLAKLTTLKVQGNPLICPPMKVVEQGVDAVREYMTVRMNREEKEKNKKKMKRRSWLGKMVACGATKGRVMVGDEELFMMNKCPSVQGFTTPLREVRSSMWILSPSRLFGSPNK